MEKELDADSDLLMPSNFGSLQERIFKISYKKNVWRISTLVCKLTEILIDYIAKLKSEIINFQSQQFL